MKHQILLFFILLSNLCVHSQTLNLNKDWQFSEAQQLQWLKANVPGSLQADLLKLNKIPNPFLGLNENKIKWIENAVWLYKRNIQIEPILYHSKNINLIFEGLDTYAKVFLNGKEILTANNMFRKWVVDIKPFLKLGANLLEVKFLPTSKIGLEMAANSSIIYPADNEQGAIKISPFIRKSPMQFGWDFAPRILTVGIWKPVYVEYWNGVKIKRVQCYLKKLDAQSASYLVESQIDGGSGKYTLLVKDRSTGKILKKENIIVDSQNKFINTTFQINNPKLWWPNGKGNPFLYDLEFQILKNNRLLDKHVTKIGVKTVELINKKDSIGESFYFKINGKPLFVKGANYVPVNSLNFADEKAQLIRLFKSMKESHFNMVRVWGGGYYASDEFYDLADSYGILIWQDFPFSCTMYPGNDAFLNNVRAEAIDNIERIRNHASLAIWCGNNEIAVGWENWGWQRSYGYSKADSILLAQDYHSLFKKLLPDLVSKFDSGRFYFHSSPISNWGKIEDFKIGDNHYWGVYHGEQPFEAYKTHIPRFNSEFGFQSFPSWNTLQGITNTTDPKMNNPILVARQKSYKGNALLTQYMNWYLPAPFTDQDYFYQTQLVQALGMQTAIEASRGVKPFNMGTLVWQLNDSWPAISWSTIEYNGKWKAAQYFIKKAYAPVIVIVGAEGDFINIKVVSDLPNAISGKLIIEKWNMKGLQQKLNPINLLVGSDGVGAIKVSKKSLGIMEEENDFINCVFKYDVFSTANALFYFKETKDLKLKNPVIQSSFLAKGKSQWIVLKSNVLVKNIEIDLIGNAACAFGDNYFDMLPNKTYKVKITTQRDLAYLKKNIRFNYVKRRN